MSDVILHAFNWSYEEIENSARAIRDAGYAAELFPPPLYSDERVATWWQRYQPKDYRILRSHLGNKAGLVRAVRAVREQRLFAYADIVFNHMANEALERSDTLDFPGARMLERYRDPAEGFENDRLYGDLSEPLFDQRSFHPCRGIRDWLDMAEVSKCWLGALPELTLSVWVIKQQLECLRALNDLGFDGYRVDVIKPLPVHHIQSVFQNPILKDKFVFGELLTFNDAENESLLWPVVRRSTLSFCDFPLQQTLQRVFAPGGSLRELVNPSSSGEGLPWNRAVTFSVMHEVPNNDSCREMLLSPIDEMLANAYLLGREGGVPLIYSDHGESARKYPEDAGRWSELWRRPDMLGMLAFHNEMAGKSQRCLFAQDGCIVLGRETRGMLAINKTPETQHVALHQHSLALGEYQCRLHGHRMTLNADPFSLSIAPRSAQMWVWQR
ncbi:MAG TPA: hypothetical protein VKP30_03165 [Polyangiaceae bacterium]|nr:hypothetical protein [Polyangiaceae bacterium]